LEQTPEFGMMKSVGADDRHVRRLMLCEGAVLGVAGGVISIVVSVLAASLGGRILKMYVEGRVGQSVPGHLFQFSVATGLAAIVVSVLLCRATSVIRAIRTSLMAPIVAM
jgi:putative ABC transport system permease protein